MLGYVVVAFVISQLSDRLGACNILDPAQFHNSAQIRTLKSCSHLLRHLSTVYSRALSNGTRSFALLPWERINTMTCSSYLPKCSLMCPLPSPLQHRFFFCSLWVFICGGLLHLWLLDSVGECCPQDLFVSGSCRFGGVVLKILKAPNWSSRLNLLSSVFGKGFIEGRKKECPWTGLRIVSIGDRSLFSSCLISSSPANGEVSCYLVCTWVILNCSCRVTSLTRLETSMVKLLPANLI